jgi:nitrate reductase molybdenum cofactor assembly chaperone NarJ/NarW
VTNDTAAILIMVSKMLDYPNEDFHQEYPAIQSFAKEHISSEEVLKEIEEKLQPLIDMSIQELQELYVDTFDYKEKTGLYLTAHELGDSRKRGNALIKLQKLIHESGYESTSKELVDYIPMLLEFLAVAPEEEKEVAFLSLRLSYAIHRVLQHLPTSNPYHEVVNLLMTFVFEPPRSEEIAKLENEREEADLDPLPYPVMYQ